MIQCQRGFVYQPKIELLVLVLYQIQRQIFYQIGPNH